MSEVKHHPVGMTILHPLSLVLLPGGKAVSTMNNGKVKFFNDEKGFGFISPEQGGQDVFVHKTGTRERLQEGDAVTYELEQTQRGPSAVNVRKA